MGYENYIDTGEFWVKAIPASWEIKRLKSIFTFGKGLPITKADLMEVGVPVISYGQVHAKYNTGTGLSDSLFRFVPESFLASHPQCLVHKNDFIVADTSEDRTGCGNCAFVDRETPLFAGYHSIILRNRENEENKYLAYLFLTDAWRSQIRAKVDGVKLFSISKAILGSANIILPPREEQDQIVRYLDWQLSKINKLIHGYQKEIKLLEERKKSLITYMVTHDRHSDERKPSEIYWLADVPANWRVTRLKHILQKQDRPVPENAELLICSNHGYVTPRGDNKLGLVAENDDIYQGVKKGDLLIHGMDTWHGAIAISNYNGMCTPVVHVCTSTESSRFICYYLRMMAFTKVFKAISNGVRQNTSDFRSWDKAGALYIALPSLEEQEIIADIIDAKINDMDKGIEKLKKQIEVMHEYRTRLISDVVTGQMDVRGIEIPDYTPEDDRENDFSTEDDTMEEDNLGEDDGSDE